jgi:hypothetical protein
MPAKTLGVLIPDMDPQYIDVLVVGKTPLLVKYFVEGVIWSPRAKVCDCGFDGNWGGCCRWGPRGMVIGPPPKRKRRRSRKCICTAGCGKRWICHCSSKRAQFQRARILDKEGRDCVRGIWFKKAMANMAQYLGIPRGTVEMGVYIEGDYIPILDAKPKAACVAVLSFARVMT